MILSAIQGMHHSRLTADELVEAIGERALARARDAALFDRYAPVLSFNECHPLTDAIIDEVVSWLERRRFKVLDNRGYLGYDIAIAIMWEVRP